MYILSLVSQYTANNFLYPISLVNWHNKRKHIVSFLQSTSSTRISLHSSSNVNVSINKIDLDIFKNNYDAKQAKNYA